MKKNYIAVAGAVAGFLFVGGGIFLWQENQKAVADLNKNLPEGVRVEKSFIGDTYKVVNKVDGYEFRVPSKMNGLGRIGYENFAIEESRYTPYMADALQKSIISETSLLVEEGLRGFTLTKFTLRDEISLENFIENFESAFISAFQTEQIKINVLKDGLVLNGENIVKIHGIAKTSKKEIEMPYFYLFKNQSNIYLLLLASDDEVDQQIVKETIINGKWQIEKR